jgi:hypothetical protein
MEISRVKNGHFIKYTKKYYIFLNKDLYQVTKNVGQIYFFLKLYIQSFNLRIIINFESLGVFPKKNFSKWDIKISCQMLQSTWAKPLKMRSYIKMD